MTNEEILQKAIDKAIKNGYENPFGKKRKTVTVKNIWGIINCQDTYDSYFHIIYSHDFAKTFFGENKVSNPFSSMYEYNDDSISSWEAGLMDMVVSEDPIKYLEQFLDK